MRISRTTVTVGIERDEFWEKKQTPNSLVQMKTHCLQQVLELCCAVTESINGEQARCHPAHQLSSASWLEKPTSSPSFYSKSAKCWKSSCEQQPQHTSKHRPCSCYPSGRICDKIKTPPTTCDLMPDLHSLLLGEATRTTCHELKCYMGTNKLATHPVSIKTSPGSQQESHFQHQLPVIAKHPDFGAKFRWQQQWPEQP